MSPAPPPYPRTPYLWSPGEVGDDVVLPEIERRRWFVDPVQVEEKLDGANVAIWFHGGRPKVASRGGPDAMDRAGQLGPLRAWVGGALDRVGNACAGGWVLYAEWLWLRHTVYYDLLPEPLVALDLFHPEGGFADHASRRARLVRSGLTPPPLLFGGVLGTVTALTDLMGPSRFGHEPMEGVVLRGGTDERCKVVRPGFVRAGDDEIARTRNRVALA